MWKKDPTIGWWRSKTVDTIKLVNKNDVSADFTSTISRKHYQNEMKELAICSSPFGKGEICYRDYECFTAGSLLLKPSMEHLYTWPDLYVDGVTYVSHQWDFQDFAEKIDHILSNTELYDDIASEGQKRLHQALSDGNAFAERFNSIICV